ncbi:MAG: PAS domain S-box protein [Burkholderiales bacterium]|nr:PAS domain S-box protein [Burkholderiales bacterium]
MRLDTVSRSGLLIFTAAGVLALALWTAIGYALQASEREALARADTQGRNLARSMAENLASSVRAIDLVLLHLRDDWIASTLPFPEQVARHQAKLKREHVAQLIIAAADGRVAYSSLPGFEGVNVSDRPFFKGHKELHQRELQLGAPTLEPGLKQLTIAFTRPIYDRQERFAGVLALLIAPPALERVYNEIDLGDDATITLVRADGQILARSHDLARISAVSLTDIPGLGAGVAPAGSYRRMARTDGVERLYSYQQIPGYPLTIFVGQALGTVLAPYRTQRASYLTAGAVATALLAAVALLLVQREREREKMRLNRARLEAELRESEERFRLIAENIDEVVWSADVMGGKNFYISPGYERIWGRSRLSLQDNPRSYADAIHPEDREHVLADLQAEKSGQPFEHEYRIVLPDGSLRWIWDRRYPVRAESGEVIRYVGAAQDVTKRKLAEQALREKIAHLQLVYDTSSAAIFDLDVRGVITHANRRMAQMFALPLERLIGSEYAQHLHPDECESGRSQMLALIEGRMDALDRERRYRREDGSEFWGRVTGRRICGASGEIAGLVGVIVDITETRQAEDALRRNEARLRELFETFPIAVAHVDKAERLTFANRYYRESYGEDYAGRTVREFVGDKVYAVLQPIIERALAGEVVQYEHSFVGDNGQINTRALRYIPDRDAAGEVVGFFALREDITDRRRAEEQIFKLSADLEWRVHERTSQLSAANAALLSEVNERRLAEKAALDLAERLQNMTRRLGEAQELERRRLAAELHDGVGSHLAAIGLNLVILQKQLAQGNTANMQRRLSELIALIDQAKANAKEISIDLRPLLLEDRDLLPALEEYARKFEGSTGIEVRVSGENSRGRLPADEKIALFRIAQEALTNCAKHARASVVAIEFNSHADHLVLSVSDDGVGLDLTGIDRANQGLGLLSMQERAEAIGGRWQIESAPGKGTRVSVSVGVSAGAARI